MSLILSEKHPLFNILNENGITAFPEETPHDLRIGMLNLMPEAEKYEHSILSRLGMHPSSIKIIFIRSDIHSYTSSDKRHLNDFYVTFKDAVRNEPLDGLIITGAPVEKIAFEDVKYWPEIIDILNFSRKHIKGVMGLCWGGMALAKYLGVGKTVFQEKIFGVFPSENLNPDHPVTGSSGNIFFCPQSRYAGFDEEVLKDKAKAGEIELLAWSEETGHFIFSSSDRKFTGHIGHPEYTPERIIFEYERDMKAGLGNIPGYFDPANPHYNWERTGTAFFTCWLDTLISS